MSESQPIERQQHLVCQVLAVCNDELMLAFNIDLFSTQRSQSPEIENTSLMIP